MNTLRKKMRIVVQPQPWLVTSPFVQTVNWPPENCEPLVTRSSCKFESQLMSPKKKKLCLKRGRCFQETLWEGKDHLKCVKNLGTFWMNDEAIIELGSRMWELKAVIHATPSSIFIHDSSYHIQCHSMIFSCITKTTQINPLSWASRFKGALAQNLYRKQFGQVVSARRG